MLKEQYKSLYKTTKYKRNLSKIERTFLHDYKNINSFIEIHNNNYLKLIRSQTTILDNVNGYPLDEYQSRVVLSNEPATLVIAGAGSGKSLTIIGKIIYLVKNCNINPKDILCISFTNDATINLKNNIQKNYNFDINIYTFHKLSLEILKQNNIEYQISPEEHLSIIIDNFIDNIVPKSSIYQKHLTRILGKAYSKKELINLKRLIRFI